MYIKMRLILSSDMLCVFTVLLCYPVTKPYAKGNMAGKWTCNGCIFYSNWLVFTWLAICNV